MSSPGHLTFHRFPEFPTELRLAIWRHCLPHRVLELDYPVDESVFDPGEPPWWYETNHDITKYNTRVPVIARVCRESRQVVSEAWTVLALPEEGHPAYWTEGWKVYPEPWFDRIRTEFIHLGWFPTRDIESGYRGDPLRYLMWAAAKTEHGRVSIAMDFLLEHSGPQESDHRAIWKRTELADLMRQLPVWTVVIEEEPVIVKADVQIAAASGLFGLLADSRVQIVEADDEALMDRFLALGDVPGVTLSSTTFKEAAQVAKLFLPETVTAIFGSEENAPRFQVAVMFRLWSRMGKSRSYLSSGH
ncbi:hypothetical protein QBC46DRAFT_389268 [Diplogelasinospora grovesii]|uniref:2EXR domain-containing protein n=1 Tax=Diplogelasinospora grovesii TaxID=303347 RepID=A0AAN6S2M1_9PEZI|nr:hypothetical protein QBC46DRAFT_389268 [Diplogelasinospora grovesii]